MNNEVITYLVWKDDDPKKPVRAKLVEAIKRYVAKFGEVPTECLVRHEEFEELLPHETIPLRIAERHYIPRWHFYIGRAKG